MFTIIFFIICRRKIYINQFEIELPWGTKVKNRSVNGTCIQHTFLVTGSSSVAWKFESRSKCWSTNAPCIHKSNQYQINNEPQIH
jgi:hypothetical protein